MKNYTLLFLFALICCKSESKSSDNSIIDDQVSASDVVSSIAPADDFNQKKYSIQGNDSKNGSTQSLSIRWISEDIVEYILTFNNPSCTKTISGRAKGIKPKKEPFMNSYKGTSFEVKRYKDRKSEFNIELQIDSVNKDKAVVDLIFNEDTANENCRPESITMLEQK